MTFLKIYDIIIGDIYKKIEEKSQFFALLAENFLFIYNIISKI